MIDEGYIKFEAEWAEEPLGDYPQLPELIQYRQQLFALDWIGAYPDGIGFGNISVKLDQWDHFLISGSTTGNIKELTEAHFSRVFEVDIDANSLKCKGPIIASSESMTHAAVYQGDSSIQAVIHIHNKPAWEAFQFKYPTTAADIPYGTPAMAHAVKQLVKQIGHTGLIIMAGHEEGIIAYGSSLQEAMEQLNTHLL